MSDENNSGTPPAEDSNGKPPEGQPAPKGESESSQPPVDTAEQARRDQQSKKDKAVSEKDDLRETVDFLSSREAERARDSYVSELLTSEAEKYPNVKADDPLFKYATSKEDVEDIAKQLQNKFLDQQQDALRSVQTEDPDKGLTEEERQAEYDKLEETTKKEGRSTFGNFLKTAQRKKKA